MRLAEGPGWGRVARPLLLLALVLAAVASSARAVETAAAGKKEEEKAKVTFPPDVEAKFVKFLEKAKEAKRKFLNERMQKEIEDITKAAAVKPEGVKMLEASAQKVIDISAEDWTAKFEEMFRRELHQPPAMVRQMMDQMLSQTDAYVRQDIIAGYVPPTDSEAWATALKSALTPEQAAAWEDVRNKRVQALKKQAGDYLNRTTENAREQYTRLILGTASGIKRSLSLSKERGAQLDQLAKAAAEKSAGEWRKRAEETFLQMEENQRQALLKTRQFFMGFQSDDRPDRQDVWKQGLAKLLSADELKRLETAKEERRSRRLRVMGMLMIAEFDEKAAFTAIQRQRLQPIATRLVSEEPTAFSEPDSNYSVAFSEQAFLAVGNKANEQGIKEMIDPIQWRHWQEICSQKNPDPDSDNDGNPEEKSDGDGTKPQEIAEPEDFEIALSDFLYDKTEKEKNRMLPAMILKAEDAGRVAELGADAIGRLETAARGAADKALANWKSNADQSVRSLLQDASGQNAKRRLKSIESYNLPRDANLAPDKDMIWVNAVKAELTAGQMAAWKKAVDERTAYRNRAIALTVMTEFDRRIPLTAEQWEKLEPMIVGTVNDYAPDISMMFGYNNAARWYMQPFSIFIPFAAVPEKDFKDILGTEQWASWSGNPEFSNSRAYWSNIQQNHVARARVAK
jgi:hypothetical protein